VVRQSNSRSSPGFSPRRRRRRDARRDAILRAAARIFRDRGVAETGMREIAEAADLSPANLYHYFRGKDEILFYCQDRTLERLLASVATARRDSRRADARLFAILAAHVRTLVDDVEGATAQSSSAAIRPS
jgi:AcrR family transcriptional regulator